MNIKNSATNNQNEQCIGNQEQDLIVILSNIEKHLATLAYAIDYKVFNSIRRHPENHPVPED